MVENREKRAPRCFISYSWDTEEHKAWVRKLASDLRAWHVDVILDQWNLHPGDNAVKFMETSVREADYVLLVCSPAFKEKSDERLAGTGWEASVVTGEMLVLNKEVKFIPILRTGDEEASLPSYLLSRVYVDFRSPEDYANRLEDVAREMLGVPRFEAPPLGDLPSFISEQSASVDRIRADLPTAADVPSKLDVARSAEASRKSSVDETPVVTTRDGRAGEAEIIRISVYHWLPLAANMFPQIERSVADLWKEGVRREQAKNEIAYNVDIPFRVGVRAKGGGPRATGRIDSRGFAQHVVTLPRSEGTINEVLQGQMPEILASVSRLLLAILPSAVRNKLAVQTEGIVSFADFPGADFKDSIDVPAATFLDMKRIVAVVVTGRLAPPLTTGFRILVPNADPDDEAIVDIDVPPIVSSPSVATNRRDDCIFIYADSLDPGENPAFDGVVYKLCAFEVLNKFLGRAIEILKDTRENVIPLRRQLAIALQRRTEEHFDFLRDVKKYLTYVNIKLPVIDKVQHHLIDVYESPEFKDKIRVFNPSLSSWSELTRNGLNAQRRAPPRSEHSANDLGDWHSPSRIGERLGATVPSLDPKASLMGMRENFGRLIYLYQEDVQEVDVLSKEAAQVLEGTIMAEELQVAIRRLDAAQATLELDRAAKNRANALKILSIVASVGTALLLAGTLGVDSLWGSGVVAILSGSAAWLFIQKYIQKSASLYRLVIPVGGRVDSDAMERFAERHSQWRREGSAGRRVVHWSQEFYALLDSASWLSNRLRWRRKAEMILSDPGRASKLSPWKFDVSLDYEKRGYVHSITLETEYDKQRFSTRDLVVQIVEEMQEERLELLDGRVCTLAELLVQLEVRLVVRLPALAPLLAMTAESLDRILLAAEGKESGIALTEREKDLATEIRDQRFAYVSWLIDAGSNERLMKLLGERNVQDKLKTLTGSRWRIQQQGVTALVKEVAVNSA